MNIFSEEALIPEAKLAFVSLPLLSAACLSITVASHLPLTFSPEFLWEKCKFVLLLVGSIINHTILRWGESGAGGTLTLILVSISGESWELVSSLLIETTKEEVERKPVPFLS